MSETEHFQQKWEPVLRPEMRQNKNVPHHVDTTAKLVRMINQIARNLVHDKDPIGATTEHIRAFWSARMIAQLLDHGPAGLDPIAVAAFERLALGAPVEHRHDATDSADDGCDAG